MHGPAGYRVGVHVSIWAPRFACYAVPMAKYAGVVHHSDLEGGSWELACSDGRRFTLANPDAGLKRDGLRVEVEGTVDDDAMGIAMAGPTLEVKRYRVLS